MERGVCELAHCFFFLWEFYDFEERDLNFQINNSVIGPVHILSKLIVILKVIIFIFSIRIPTDLNWFFFYVPLFSYFIVLPARFSVWEPQRPAF